jgi:hypothetical protein
MRSLPGSQRSRWLAVLVGLAVTAVSCSSQVAPAKPGSGLPNTVAITGRLTPPAGYSAAQFSVVGLGKTGSVSAAGSFSVQVRRKGVTLVAAIPRGGNFALMQVVDGETSSTVISPRSTADALMFLTPLWATTVPAQVMAMMKVIDENAAVATLGTGLSTMMGRANLLGSSHFLALYDSAVRSVATELAVTMRRPLTPPSRSDTAQDTAFLRGAAFLRGIACTQTVPITPGYDQTDMTTGSSPCRLTLTTDGPASEGLGLQIATTDWLWTAAPVSAAASSQPGLSPGPSSAAQLTADAGQACTAYSGEQNASAPMLLVPPQSVYSWLSTPVSAIIKAAAVTAVPALSADPGYRVPTGNTVYVYRAYSGGGQLVTALNPGLGDDSCLNSATGTVADPGTLASAALAINLLTTGLNVIVPVIDIADPDADRTCQLKALTAALGAIETQLGSGSAIGQSVGSLAESLLTGVISLLPSLADCIASNAVNTSLINWLVDVYKADKALVTKVIGVAQLFPLLGAAAINLINLAEYSHPVESGFVEVGSPFTTSSTPPPPSSSPTPGSSTTTFSVSPNQQWNDTGISVNAGERVTITATGTVYYDVNQPQKVQTWSKPAGWPWDSTEPFRYNNRCPDSGSVFIGDMSLPGKPCGSLVARIGNGPPFEIGTSASFDAPASGSLMLGVNVWYWGAESGGFKATITR